MRQRFFLMDAVLQNERLQWDEDNQCRVQLAIGKTGRREKKVNEKKAEKGGGRGGDGKTC